MTNLNKRVKNMVKFYNSRGTAEQWIKEGKNAVKWTKLSCRTFKDNQTRLQMFALAYSLAKFLRRLALPREVDHWSLTTLREKLIKIGTKVTRHAKYVTFQLAEVAVTRNLFAAILKRIAEAGLEAVAGRGACLLTGSSGGKRGFQREGSARTRRWPLENAPVGPVPCSRSRPNRTGHGKTSKNPHALAAGGRIVIKWAASRAWSGSRLNPNGKCRINRPDYLPRVGNKRGRRTLITSLALVDASSPKSREHNDLSNYTIADQLPIHSVARERCGRGLVWILEAIARHHVQRQLRRGQLDCAGRRFDGSVASQPHASGGKSLGGHHRRLVDDGSELLVRRSGGRHNRHGGGLTPSGDGKRTLKGADHFRRTPTAEGNPLTYFYDSTPSINEEFDLAQGLYRDLSLPTKRRFTTSPLRRPCWRKVSADRQLCRPHRANSPSTLCRSPITSWGICSALPPNCQRRQSGGGQRL